MIKITNTLTSQKEEFMPLKGKQVNMFVCGPTVYDYIHIGNARTFVFFDVVAKYLRYRGYEVNYIQNITDTDDKIIQRAKENNCNPLKWAKEYEEKFMKDMKDLGIDSVSRYARATDHIEQVVKQVKTLIDKGYAYFIDDDGYYFDLKTFPEYGKLSGRTSVMANDAVSRIDENGKKRNKGDFCLWKLSKEGEPAWDFETGKYLGIVETKGLPAEVFLASKALAKEAAKVGRPGWHIEDTAITEHYFGPQYDLHGGGQDLIFPHHEAEITQQESASGEKPFVKYWMHVAFVVIPVKSGNHGADKAQKMSKSLGNFVTAKELLQKHPKEVLRFYLLSGYYRSPLDFSDAILKQSEAGVSRIYEFIQKLNLTSGNGKENIEDKIENARQKFLKAMNSDFNTPQAFAVIFDLIRNLNLALIQNSLGQKSVEKAKNFIEEVNSIFGIVPSKQEKIPDKILELVEKREGFRVKKNWEEADKIRTQIEELGWRVEDTIYGPLTIKI